MRFLLTPNTQREDALAYTRALAPTLCAAGHTPLLLPETAALGDWPGAAVWDGNQDPDMLLIAGGDGTLIKFVRDVGRFAVPVFGVNFGHLGYLTSCEPAQADEALRAILSGHYTIEARSLLRGRVVDKGGRQKAAFWALNEADICRGGLARALRLELTIGGSFVRSLSADGLIVSTPTGSTAYNFSAGGPVLMPTLDCMAVTPVCPHAALDCSIVASGQDAICVRVRIPQPEEGATPLLVADGCEKYPLDDGDEVQLEKAPETVRLVKTGEENFYAKLQRKLSEG